jgi:hypothetical protein
VGFSDVTLKTPIGTIKKYTADILLLFLVQVLNYKVGVLLYGAD